MASRARRVVKAKGFMVNYYHTGDKNMTVRSKGLGISLKASSVYQRWWW